MSENQQQEIVRIAEQIKEKYNPEKIILFGSFVYGKPNSSSDVDLAIIKTTKERFLDRLKKISYLIKSTLGTDILVYTPTEWQKLLKEDDYFIKEIDKKGKVIYEKK